MRKRYRPKGKSYFSGSGGFDIGLMQAGVDIIQSLDISKDSTDIMRANPHYFGHNVVNADISKITVLDQPKADVHIYTYPCTKYSAIADIHGTRTGDELYLHALRHFALEQPEAYVLENVPGMKKFKIVMEAMTMMPGYYVTVICPVSATNWLPQKRDRLIIFGTRRPFSPSHPVPASKIPRIKDLLEKDPEIIVSKSMRSRMAGKYRDMPIIIDPENSNAIAPTAMAHYYKDFSTRVIKDKRSPIGVRAFTIREYANIQGYPADFKFPDKVISYQQIGNSVPPPMGYWAGTQIVNYFNNIAA